MNQTPEINNSVKHAAAGNLAFLLSVIRCGESLSEDEESHVREIIQRLELESKRIEISGLWLRRKQAGDTEVLIERDGEWTLVLTEYGDTISHIVEPSGLLKGKPDPLGNGK